MRINHNIAALNTYRQLGAANNAQQGSMEKLSSGLRINSAKDDAAGLAISEKMRGQIRGLDQASANAQDANSMIQTAEGALNETHDILQRMRELATQAANDTNTETDRNEIQKEVNQLTSEINRIGNTTEFNTQSLLKGDGGSKITGTGVVSGGNLTSGDDIVYGQAEKTLTVSTKASADDKVTFNLNGIELDYTFEATESDTDSSAATLREGLQDLIDNNEVLKGNYTVSGTGSDVKITAAENGDFKGASSFIGATSVTDGDDTGPNTPVAFSNTDAVSGTTTPALQASKTIDFSGISDSAGVEALVGKGFTANGQQIEFYDANDGAYTGDAIGVNLSNALATGDGTAVVSAIATQLGTEKVDGLHFEASGTDLVIKAAEAGSAGNNIKVSDGGIQSDFTATFQVGANKGQSMTIEIGDMRASALGIAGKVGEDGFSSTNNVTNGTNNTSVESALDVTSHESASKAIETINNAIETVSAERSKLGAYQNRLDHTINNLSTSSENLTAAESRIRDVDMAKEMMEQTKNSILSQASQAMLAQSQQLPQSVLQLLR